MLLKNTNSLLLLNDGAKERIEKVKELSIVLAKQFEQLPPIDQSYILGSVAALEETNRRNQPAHEGS